MSLHHGQLLESWGRVALRTPRGSSNQSGPEHLLSNIMLKDNEMTHLEEEKEMATHSSTLPSSLVGCSPWGREELDTTERLHFASLHLEEIFGFTGLMCGGNRA